MDFFSKLIMHPWLLFEKMMISKLGQPWFKGQPLTYWNVEFDLFLNLLKSQSTYHHTCNMHCKKSGRNVDFTKIFLEICNTQVQVYSASTAPDALRLFLYVTLFEEFEKTWEKHPYAPN